MSFRLKNALFEFQNIMNNICNQYSQISIVYLDDVLIYSEDMDQHFKHFHTFLKFVKKNGLVVCAKNIKLFQTSIIFLGHSMSMNYIKESLNPFVEP